MRQNGNNKIGDNSPLVSAIIPYYERPKLLKRALISVVEQTYPRVELIIVDDCSQTRSAKSVVNDIEESRTKLDDLTIYRHNTNQGVCEARNTGIQNANGEYVAFLDDDDSWKRRKITEQINVINNTDLSLVYCGVQRTGPEGNVRATHSPKKDGEMVKTLLCGNRTGTISTLLISRELARKIDGFDPQFLRWNDWDFTLRAAKQTEFGVIPQLLTTQHHSNQTQLSDDHEKLKLSALRFHNKHSETAAKHDMYRTFRGWIEWGLGHSAMGNGLYYEARRHFLTSLKYNPKNMRAYVYLIAVSGGSVTYEPLKRLRRTVFTKIQTIKNIFS